MTLRADDNDKERGFRMVSRFCPSALGGLALPVGSSIISTAIMATLKSKEGKRRKSTGMLGHCKMPYVLYERGAIG